MGHIPAPHLTLISALASLKAEVINDFTGSYGDNTEALVAAFDRVLDGMADAFATDETAVGDGNSHWEADDEVITEADHGLEVGDLVRVAIDSGATGASAGYYYVKTVPSSSTFTLSATPGGATVAISVDGVVDVFKVNNPVAVLLAQKAKQHLTDLLGASGASVVAAVDD